MDSAGQPFTLCAANIGSVRGELLLSESERNLVRYMTPQLPAGVYLRYLGPVEEEEEKRPEEINSHNKSRKLPPKSNTRQQSFVKNKQFVARNAFGRDGANGTPRLRPRPPPVKIPAAPMNSAVASGLRRSVRVKDRMDAQLAQPSRKRHAPPPKPEKRTTASDKKHGRASKKHNDDEEEDSMSAESQSPIQSAVSKKSKRSSEAKHSEAKRTAEKRRRGRPKTHNRRSCDEDSEQDQEKLEGHGSSRRQAREAKKRQTMKGEFRAVGAGTDNTKRHNSNGIVAGSESRPTGGKPHHMMPSTEVSRVCGDQQTSTAPRERLSPEEQAQLQKKLDNLDEDQLDRVLEFLSNDLGNGDEGQELHLDLDSLPLEKQRALVEVVDAEIRAAALKAGHVGGEAAEAKMALVSPAFPSVEPGATPLLAAAAPPGVMFSPLPPAAEPASALAEKKQLAWEVCSAREVQRQSHLREVREAASGTLAGSTGGDDPSPLTPGQTCSVSSAAAKPTSKDSPKTSSKIVSEAGNTQSAAAAAPPQCQPDASATTEADTSLRDATGTASAAPQPVAPEEGVKAAVAGANGDSMLDSAQEVLGMMDGMDFGWT